MSIVTLSVDEMPPYPKKEDAQDETYQIAIYLESLLTLLEAQRKEYLFFPSLRNMAERVFKCSQVEVQAALQLLRSQGYDSMLMGSDCPITLQYHNPKGMPCCISSTGTSNGYPSAPVCTK